ncbi:MAG: hypothetical protein ACI9N1_003154 [Flavobacteriales bacterium]
MRARSLEEQIESKRTSKLRLIQKGFESIRIQGRVSSYYIMEISRCIDRGMFLASIELCTTLVEIWLRDLLVVRKATTDLSISKDLYRLLITKYDREIEGASKRGLSSHRIIKELEELDVLTTSEVDWLMTLFKKVRNLFHHGLSGRVVDPDYKSEEINLEPSSRTEAFLALAFGNPPDSRLLDFEEFLDLEAERILEETLNFLSIHELPSVTN